MKTNNSYGDDMPMPYKPNTTRLYFIRTPLLLSQRRQINENSLGFLERDMDMVSPIAKPVVSAWFRCKNARDGQIMPTAKMLPRDGEIMPTAKSTTSSSNRRKSHL
jgi:hypothetical protein